MTARVSVAGFTRAGIHALAHADATELERLTETAGQLRRPATAEEQRRGREELRTLQMLLVLTRRNLRVLRGDGGCAAEDERLAGA